MNPLQFGEAVDLERYPRTLEADMALLEEQGVDLVFAPSVDEMYPGGEPLVRITAGPLGGKWEGASRPGHFDGALTVVAKLLHYGIPGTGLPAAVRSSPAPEEGCPPTAPTSGRRTPSSLPWSGGWWLT